MKNIALILASGNGQRCELGFPKQFAKIGSKTVLEICVDKFEKNDSIDEIIVVTSQNYLEMVRTLLLNDNYKKVKEVVKGGKTRKDSSYNGISAIKDNEANVLIHDGVRPLISDEIIEKCLKALELHDAVCVAIESTDTVYEISDKNTIKSIPNRNFLKRAQTPQCFKLSLILKAHMLALDSTDCIVTDDCGLVHHYGLCDIYLVEGDENNIKITYKDDLDFVQKFLNIN